MNYLLIDIGNTYIKLLYLVDYKLEINNLLKIHISTDTEYIINTIRSFLSFNSIDITNLLVIFCTVNHRFNKDITLSLLRKIFNRNIYQLTTKMLIDKLNKNNINLSIPNKLGIDRGIKSLGLFKYYSNRSLSIDFGSATVLDLIIDDIWIEGSILSGLRSSIDALNNLSYFSSTASNSLDYFIRYIKKNNYKLNSPYSSIDAILDGIFISYIAFIDRKIDIYTKLYNVESIVLTGGLSTFIYKILKNESKHYKRIILDPYLIFKGYIDILQIW